MACPLWARGGCLVQQLLAKLPPQTHKQPLQSCSTALLSACLCLPQLSPEFGWGQWTRRLTAPSLDLARLLCGGPLWLLCLPHKVGLGVECYSGPVRPAAGWGCQNSCRLLLLRQHAPHRVLSPDLLCRLLLSHTHAGTTCG